ncbi:UDP-N-acetylmuramoyl-L-alanyl-D-glutamate--2,6-diaminopimelate ligase [Bombella sp. ESL0380]|uniref:UDP-N-acetylmuramoyl-L-alanyl-D-glutamate--2, 6-diaminopimelate ligase n=1 Tax=Bombella sp. ESL0380 TaxID=2676444 RepID=UPI00139CC12D|nr:UDP-N-acetylmuramoyl-L-alanyl-D-glutamate--2,6-diaminopimelate ligase [Bombella sp. ESL0380]
MKLSSLLRHHGLARDLTRDPDISSITADSREARPGCLFVALKGTKQDGRTFIPLAIAEGAAAIVLAASPGQHHLPEQTENGHTALIITLPDPARFLARSAALLAGAQPDHIAAITGTNGKSSTADFFRQLCQLRHQKAASLGTLGLISDVALPSLPPLTTPDAVTLANTLAALQVHGITHVALEASSHGLQQHRLDGVAITAAAFSNLTRDHLDYHHTLEAYRQAKLHLFETLLPEGGRAVINSDMDAESKEALHDIATRRKLDLRTIGTTGETIRILEATPTPQGMDLTLQLHGRTLPALHFPLPGRFQAENALLAAALCWERDEEAESIIALLPHLKGVPGRCEPVAHLPNGACAYVDYAHTPDALEHVLLSLRPHTSGRLVVVFGAGGDRDRGKRPLMGQIAAHLADEVIITDDNPRSEDPATIRAEILATAPQAQEIGDRRQAIRTALEGLKKGDVLLIAGKGHETGQIIKGEIHPFDDRTITAALARELA